MKLSSCTDQQLAELVRSGNEAAKAEIVERHEGLIFLCLRRHNLLHWVDDLAQEGRLAIIKAAVRYDASKGKFSTYAMWWVRRDCQRACRHYRRPITIPVAPLKEAFIPDYAILSLDTRVGGGGEDALGDLHVDDSPSPDQLIDLMECRREVSVALQSLPPQQREVITRLFGLNGQGGYTVTERDLCKEMGVSYQRVHAIKKQALATMREAIETDNARGL